MCATSKRLTPAFQPAACSGRVRRFCTLCALIITVACSAPVQAQTPVTGTPLFPFDSPLATPLATPSPTPTPTATPSPTPTVDLATAVLQVSPLRVTPDDRPANQSGALLWIIAAATLVLAGAVVMAVAQRRENTG